MVFVLSFGFLYLYMSIREDISEKNVFFRALPESPNPHPPNLGNLVLFFERQKRRFARMTDEFIDDNNGCNDNYDDNYGNFDDNYDKNDQKKFR